jgi:hypothetical protein
MYKNNNEIKSIVIFVLSVLFLYCCKNKPVETNNQNNQNNIISHCDTMVYTLPDKTTDVILEMIKDKRVSHCDLVLNYNDEGEARYSFSFPYDDKTLYTQRDTILLQKTNIFLNLKGKMFPVITTFDNLFADIPETTLYAINDFNFCFVEVDVMGNVVGGFAY